MIRFVDIRGQGTSNRFAFWDTCVDRFINLDGDQAWNTWEQFEDSFNCHYAGEAAESNQKDRYKSICHGWVFDGGEDDVEGFYMGEAATFTERVTPAWLAKEIKAHKTIVARGDEEKIDYESLTAAINSLFMGGQKQNP
jgi:hypothetical protein